MIDRRGILEIWRKKNSSDIEKYESYNLSSQFKNMVEMFAPGDFYFWILNFQNFEIEYVHPRIEKVLKLDPHTFTVEQFFSLLPPEEIAKTKIKEDFIMNFLLDFLDSSDIMDYKIVYDFKIKDTKGNIKHILNQVSTLSLSHSKKCQHMMFIHTEISHLNFDLQDTVSFVNLKGGKSYYYLDPSEKIFDPEKVESEAALTGVLSEKELEIIELLAQGKSSSEIAVQLDKSKNTVDTQRRNILQKTGCTSIPQVVFQCIFQGVVKV